MSIKTLFKNCHSDKTVVFIHGMASSSDSWKHTETHVQFLGFNTLSLDLSGHGDSSHLNSYSFYGWIREVIDALDKHNVDPHAVVGHSMGGLIAAGVAHQTSPEKVLLIDPLLHVPNSLMQTVIKQVMSHYDNVSAAAISKSHPSWTEPMINEELVTLGKWDKSTLDALDSEAGWDIASRYIFNNEHPETLLVKPQRSFLIPSNYVDTLMKNNINVQVMPNVGHSLHHDNRKGHLMIVEEFLHRNGLSNCD